MDDPGWSRSILSSLAAATQGHGFTGSDWALLIVLLVALLIAALSAAAETALTSVSRIRVRNNAEEGDVRAQHLLRLFDNPERFLSAILVTSNVAVITSSTVSTILCVSLFGEQLGGIIATVAVSLIVLIFCEITPKTWAVQAPERRARLFVGPVEVLSRVLGPLVRVLIFLTKGIVRLFGGGQVKRGPFVTEDELRLLVEVGEQEGVLEQEEREMIHNVFELADTTVREVMVPRPDMVTVEATATIDEAMKLIVEGGQSRLPVYDDSLDDIIGVLYAKDLLRVLTYNDRPSTVRTLVRKAYFVPESKRLDDLLREMQSQRVHMAIVVDEYGSVAGLATIEDLVEEIIGDIQDEYDKEEQLFQRISDNEYIVDAKISLDDLDELLDTSLASEEYDTLGGLIYAKLDKIPSAGDTVTQADLTFTVLGTKGRRITKVRVVRAAPGGPTPDTADSAGDDDQAESDDVPRGEAGSVDGSASHDFLVARRDDAFAAPDHPSPTGYTSEPQLNPAPPTSHAEQAPADPTPEHLTIASRTQRPRGASVHRSQGHPGAQRRR